LLPQVRQNPRSAAADDRYQPRVSEEISVRSADAALVIAA
jgi:hypothetical protein